MKFNSIVLTFSLLCLLAVFSNELPAQTTTSGALTGVVTDASKAVVPAANVEIRDAAKGTVQTAKTDREGVYRFFFLPVPTENSVRITPHPCGPLIGDLVDALYLVGKHIGV